jgi:photosystem II stability/assembly factor-like uncharacterized protein
MIRGYLKHIALSIFIIAAASCYGAGELPLKNAILQNNMNGNGNSISNAFFDGDGNGITNISAESITNISNYLLRNGTLPMTGNLDTGGNIVSNAMFSGDGKAVTNISAESITNISNYLLRDGTLPMTGNLDAGGNVVSNAMFSGDGSLVTNLIIVRYVDNGDGTVEDTDTGLVWDKNANHGQKSWADAISYISTLNSTNYKGHNDWRLPSIYQQDGENGRYGLPELDTIGRIDGFVNNTFTTPSFPFVGVHMSSFPYWTSVTYAPDYGGGWAWNYFMGTGNSSYASKGVTLYYVWPVRGGLPITKTDVAIVRKDINLNKYSVSNGTFEGAFKSTADFDMGGNSITNISATSLEFVGGAHAIKSSGDTLSGELVATNLQVDELTTHGTYGSTKLRLRRYTPSSGPYETFSALSLDFIGRTMGMEYVTNSIRHFNGGFDFMTNTVRNIILENPIAESLLMDGDVDIGFNNLFDVNVIGENTNFVARESVRNWNSIASSSDGSRLAAVVDGGQIYISEDFGTNWTARESVRDWKSITSSSDGSRLAAVAATVFLGGQIYISEDSGTNWTARESVGDLAKIASSSDGSRLVAVVLGGQIYISEDSGTNWAARESVRDWSGIVSSSDGSRLAAVVSGGQIYISEDSGTNWTARESVRSWTSISSSADGRRLAASASFGGQIYISEDSGTNWTARAPSGNWTSIASSSDGSRIAAAVSVNGKIYISDNYGTNWIAMESNRGWGCISSSADGSRIAATVTSGQIYTKLLNFDPIKVNKDVDFCGRSITNMNLSFLEPQVIADDISADTVTPRYRGDELQAATSNGFWKSTGITASDWKFYPAQ